MHWRGEKLFAPGRKSTMIPYMTSKVVCNFDHTILQLFTPCQHEVKNEKYVLLLHSVIYFSIKISVKSMHVLVVSHCTRILNTIATGARFPVV
jgi:hypothetical protein